jgi:hypothetical protein
VNKNVHSSSACTCGTQTSSGTKKKCCCGNGKTCDCHRKKPQAPKKNTHNLSTEQVRNEGTPQSVSTSASSVPDGGYSSKRAGEVVVPINEYVPNHPQQEIGPVFNEKAVNGIFQDVPLPFETGHGLLDLFEPSTSSLSTTSSMYQSSEHYRAPNENHHYYSLYAGKTNAERAKPQLQTHQSANGGASSSKSNIIHPKSHSVNSQNFDLFHSLGLSPTTEPQSMTPTGHPIPQHQVSDTPPTTITTSNESSTFPKSVSDTTNNISNNQSVSLFGNYSNYAVRPNLDRSESLNSRSEVEVCSITPSFNDFKQTTNYSESDSQLNGGRISSINEYVNSSVDNNGIGKEDGLDLNAGLLDNELKRLKGGNDNVEFPEMLKF